MKKYWKLLSLALLLLALSGCDQFALVPTTSSTDSQITNVTNDTTSTIDVETLALQASGAEMLLIPFLGGSSATQLGLVLVDDTTDPIIDDSVIDLDQYLGLISQFLDTETGGLNVVVTDSDREEYTYMATYTIQTLYDGLQSYTIYYNEILPVTDEVVTEDPVTEEPVTEDPVTDGTTTEPLGFHNHEPFTFEYDEEVVIAYVDALLVVGDTETTLEGAYLQEGTDTVLNLYAFTDRDNYVKVKYVTDSEGEQKFQYEVKSEGVLVSKASIKVDFEEEQKTVRLEFATETSLTTFSVVEESTADGTSYKVRYAIVTDGSIVESGNVVIVATVDAETGETVYTYTVLPDGWLHSHQFDFEEHGHQGGQHGHGQGRSQGGSRMGGMNYTESTNPDTTPDPSDTTTNTL